MLVQHFERLRGIWRNIDPLPCSFMTDKFDLFGTAGEKAVKANHVGPVSVISCQSARPTDTMDLHSSSVFVKKTLDVAV